MFVTALNLSVSNRRVEGILEMLALIVSRSEDLSQWISF